MQQMGVRSGGCSRYSFSCMTTHVCDTCHASCMCDTCDEHGHLSRWGSSVAMGAGLMFHDSSLSISLPPPRSRVSKSYSFSSGSSSTRTKNSSPTFCAPATSTSWWCQCYTSCTRDAKTPPRSASFIYVHSFCCSCRASATFA